MSLTPEELAEMARQLGCPSGEGGIFIANMMNESNAGMIGSTIEVVQLQANDSVLELGHGNGKHIPEILSQAANISYHGLEISELMKTEAETLNTTNHTSFSIYDGEKIPFDAQMFDKVITVNTLYFWKNPLALLQEIYRILKINGLCCIAFAQKEFMEKLPFTAYGFELYDEQKFELLVSQTNFKLIQFTQHTEMVKTRTNEMVERSYTVATLQK